MVNKTNPFNFGRREFEQKSSIYIPDEKEGYLTWISGQQLLFEGIRGSGKTSILRSIEYDTAWNISKTRLIFPTEIHIPSNPKHFGIKLKLEEMDVDRWESWKALEGRECAQSYFSTYIEYIILDNFLTALMDLMNNKAELFIDREADEKLVEDILVAGFPGSFKPRLRENSLRAIRRIIQENHNALRLNVFLKTQYKMMKEMHPILSPGDLVRSFAKGLREYYTVFKDSTIIPMFDDFNYLQSWQMQVINTAVFKTQTPVSYKLASVSGLRIDMTTQDGHELTENVIRKVMLPGLTPGKSRWEKVEKKLDILVQGVCVSRIQESYTPDCAKKFSYKAMLGESDIEKSLYKLLLSSEKDQAYDLLKNAQKKSRDSGNISITSTWMEQNNIRILKNKNDVVDEGKRKLIRRRDSSTYTNKWKYGASVAICNELDMNFPYNGWQIILHLSYGSIREILRIFYYLWENLDIEINSFVSLKNVEINTQRASIDNAAKSLLSILDKRPKFECKDPNKKYYTKYKIDYNPTSLPSFCLRLGDLFSKLQSYPIVAIQTEIGSLRLNKSKLDERLVALIENGIDRGVILKYNDSDDKIRIGLHPILSPIFNISYRSPFYHPIDVSITDFEQLAKGSDAEAIYTTDRLLINKSKRFLEKNPSASNNLSRLLSDSSKIPTISGQQFPLI
jgi:hypothetical protein